MPEVIWFLDVDGVLNGFDWGRPMDMTIWPYKQITANGYVINYAEEVIDLVNYWYDSDECEVRWLTTWGAQANRELSEKLGISGPLEVAAEPNYYQVSWWKLRFIRKFVEENPDQRIIWTDDDIAFDPEPAAFLEANPQILAISPLTKYGLESKHLDRIMEFVQPSHMYEEGLI